MLRLALLIALPLLVVGGVVAAVRPRLRRRSRLDPTVARSRGPVARVAPFVVLGIVFGVSFAITGDTTGTAVSLGAVALLVLVAVVERRRRRRAS